MYALPVLPRQRGEKELYLVTSVLARLFSEYSSEVFPDAVVCCEVHGCKGFVEMFLFVSEVCGNIEVFDGG